MPKLNRLEELFIEGHQIDEALKYAAHRAIWEAIRNHDKADVESLLGELRRELGQMGGGR